VFKICDIVVSVKCDHDDKFLLKKAAKRFGSNSKKVFSFFSLQESALARERRGK
jgi:hypothetical protein